MQCPRCQQDNPSHAKFCLECGAPITGATPREAPYADQKAEIEVLRGSLAAAHEQQTATSEILRVISGSPTDVQPVFDAIIASAVKLCAAYSGILVRVEDEHIHRAAGISPHREPLESVRRTFPRPLDPTTAMGQAILERCVVQLPDTESPTAPPVVRDAARAVGFRAELSVPLLRDGEPIGGIAVTRRNPGPFSSAEVRLLQTFADQAVIAIENVRLFTELQEKNRALTEAHAQVTEALEQQTATADILRVISTSPTNLQPVLDAVVKSAARFCGAPDASVFRLDGETLRAEAHHGPVAQPVGFLVPVVRGSVAGRSVLERRAVGVTDLQVETDDFPEGSALARQTGQRATLSVPLLREGAPIGVILLRRGEAVPFTDKQIDLLRTFADQAVIAIENVRLFTELQEKNEALTRAHAQVTETLEQQTATGEILRVISSSPTDVQPVFETIARSATTLCEADLSRLYRFDGNLIHFVAEHGRTPAETTAAHEAFPQPPSRLSVTARAIATAAIVQVADVSEEPEVADALRMFRTVLSVPMLRDGRSLGAITVARRVVRPFTDKQIELLKTFADQAVIAIENVRLFKELEVANRELSAASQHKSEFLANMSHELRTPLNAIIGFSEVLSEKMFGELNEKQEEYLKDIYASGTHLLSLINDILDLSKIEAGRMELELTDFHLPTALDNALTLVRERAGRRNLALQTSIDDRLGEIQGDERKIRQVVLNLLSNAIKFTPEGGRIEVGAVLRDGSVEISVTDTGVGIAPEDQEKVFEEFRQVGTAEKKAEGTGLGLTLCRKFVELHGGKIWVKSQVGMGSTFTFTIPVGIGD